MPSYVNIGAYVDDGTMVDTWATVGSCAQIGKTCTCGRRRHRRRARAREGEPVVVEDDCFIGSRCMIVEGVGSEGRELGAGLIFTASTPVIDVETGDELPRATFRSVPWSVQGTPTLSSGAARSACRARPSSARSPKVKTTRSCKLNAMFREHDIVS